MQHGMLCCEGNSAAKAQHPSVNAVPGAQFGIGQHNHLEIVAESHYKPGKDPTSQPNFGTA